MEYKPFRQIVEEKLKGKEPLGSGHNKVVYEDPENPELAVALMDFEDGTDRQMRRMFYLQKVLHFLLPKHIPDIRLASRNVKIFENVRLDDLHKAAQALRTKMMRPNSSIPEEKKLYKELGKEYMGLLGEYQEKIFKDPNYKKLSEALEELGVSPDAFTPLNFVKREDGEIQYVDTISDNTTSLDVLEKRVEDKKDDPNYHRALEWLKRIENLSNISDDNNDLDAIPE